MRVARQAEALVCVVTHPTITIVTDNAVTSVWTICVVANSNNIVAIVALNRAFIDVNTIGSISFVTSFAETLKTAVSVWTVCVDITGGRLKTFIYVFGKVQNTVFKAQGERDKDVSKLGGMIEEDKR